MRKLTLGAFSFLILAACGTSFSGGDTPDGGPTAGDGGTGGDGSATDGGGALQIGSDGGFRDAGPGGGGPQPGTDGGTVDGIFVSTSLGHDDTGNGTQSKPYKTLGKALTVAAAAKKPIIACNETYAENLALSAANATSIFGDYDCTNGWKLAAKNAVLAAPASPAVTVTNVSVGVTIGNFDITAPAAAASTAATPNSIGVLEINSPGLELSNLTVTTGDALDGTSQTEPSSLVNDGTANGSANGQPTSNTCGGSATDTGGAGGAGIQFTQKCTESASINSKMPVCTPKVAPTPNAGSAGTGGGGANGASSNGGTFDQSAGFIPGDGSAGKDGTGGAGGTGGIGTQYDHIVNTSDPGPPPTYGIACPASPMYPGTCTSSVANGVQTVTVTSNDYGVSGGAGGCPGVAGKAGTGGGSSIGIIMFVEPLTLTNVSFVTGKGGDGGKGTGGAPQTSGGSPGGSDGTPPGWSGSGAGGHSLAVASTPAPPIYSGAKGTVKLGGAGQGVAAFMSNGRTVAASANGLSQELYSF